MDYLTEYNFAWPEWFREIGHSLRPRLTHCLCIEHVGSTSIIGMAAKPIIDIDSVVPDGGIADAIISLERAGYGHQGDLGIAGRESFRPVSAATLNLPPHHLYACEASSPELHRHIAFREYLRAHPVAALRLTEFKRRLAFQQQLSRNEYIDAKSPLVAEITTQALAWYGTQEGENTIANQLPQSTPNL